jgi:5-methylcytosine-specific restriction protein A
MRNPKWHRDEIILALDLYFRQDRGAITKRNERIIELSNLLNQLPLFPNRPDEEKFRNPNGVSLKLSNFLAIDPSYGGKGMESFSKLDVEVFKEFMNDKERLHAIANEIRIISANDGLRKRIYEIEDDEETLNDSVMEGQVLYKLHKVRERDSEIVLLKKKQALDSFGFLSCEACIFDFEKFYGELGKGYIECHHKTPLSKFKAETYTRLDDLALVCSNCHRMLHRSIDTLSVENLKSQIRYSYKFG